MISGQRRTEGGGGLSEARAYTMEARLRGSRPSLPLYFVYDVCDRALKKKKLL